MDWNWQEWLNLAVRWLHVFAGILWIGQTFFFTWLDRRLTLEEGLGGKEGSAPQVWMVHSGGFYVVEKQTRPTLLPRTLHWFRWEAALTWISGMVLLGVVYYMGGALVDPDVADIAVGSGIGIGLGVIVLGWVMYDLLWRSPLGRFEVGSGTLSFLLLVGVAYGLSQLLSGRAAYIHTGALMGTIMAANVWLRILPTQHRMLAAAQAGNPPDLSLAARAQQRTKHNTYMVVPVVFIMVSNHFPVATYGHRHNWLILAVLILVGWGAAKLLRSS